MILFEKIPVSFEEKQYEIRVLYDDTTINALTFLNNHPANGFRHQVKMSKLVDVKRVLDAGVAKDLVELCRQDIFKHRWEQWSEMIQEARGA